MEAHFSRHHHHDKVYDSKKVFIETGHHELVPYDVGVVKRSHIIVGWILIFLVWAGAAGVLAWLIVEYSKERPFFCNNATTEETNNYVKYQNTAAEPYAGKPQEVVDNATTASVCQTTCNADSDCVFFTHNRGLNKCYLYRQGVLPDPNDTAAVPGPTDLKADVYVKASSRVVELRGILKDGK